MKNVFLFIGLLLSVMNSAVGQAEVGATDAGQTEVSVTVDWANRADIGGFTDYWGEATDGNRYTVWISCVPAERNAKGKDEGGISILRDQSIHTGAKVVIDYDFCETLKADLESGAKGLRVTWHAETFQSIPAPEATYELIEPTATNPYEFYNDQGVAK